MPAAAELAERLLAEPEERHRSSSFPTAAFADAEKLAERERVQLVAVGRDSGNVGITQFQVRRSLLDPIGYEILAEVRNASDEPVECRLEVDLDGSVVDVVPLKLEPSGTLEHTFREDLGRRRPPDGPARPRRRPCRPTIRPCALLPKRELVQPVTLVTQGNLFLQKVFEANPLVRLSMIKLPEDSTGPLTWPMENLPAAVPNTVTVFHRQVPEKLPPGRCW